MNKVICKKVVSLILSMTTISSLTLGTAFAVPDYDGVKINIARDTGMGGILQRFPIYSLSNILL